MVLKRYTITNANTNDFILPKNNNAAIIAKQ